MRRPDNPQSAKMCSVIVSTDSSSKYMSSMPRFLMKQRGSTRDQLGWPQSDGIGEACFQCPRVKPRHLIVDKFNGNEAFVLQVLSDLLHLLELSSIGWNAGVVVSKSVGRPIRRKNEATYDGVCILGVF